MLAISCLCFESPVKNPIFFVFEDSVPELLSSGDRSTESRFSVTKYSHLFTEIVHSSLDLVSLYLLTERNARQVYRICLHDFFL